jgi:hypothetical protein
MAKTLNASIDEKRIVRLLRRRETQEYFTDDGWTTNPAEAKSFSDVVEVAEACAKFRLEDVELTLRVAHSEASDLFCTPMR